MKIAGLAAKAAFVLFFAQQLDAGEFSRYFLAFSTALIAARLVGMGGDDELPYRVKGRRTAAGRYYGVALCLSAIGLFLTIISISVSWHSFFMCATGVSFFLAGSAFSTGALRSLDNFFQEFRANIPWVIICLIALLLPLRTAEDILYGIAASYVLLQLIEYLRLKKAGVSLSFCLRPVLRYHLSRFYSWFPKSVSTAALAASLRAFPLWIGFLHLGSTDKLAYAFAISEVAFQLAMTYVNLLHSSKKYRESAQGAFWRVALIFTTLAAFLSVALFFILRYIVHDRIGVGYELLLFSLCYTVSIALFAFTRVGAWGREASSKRASIILLLVQATMFFLPGLVLGVVGFHSYQVLLAALVNLCLIAAIHRSFQLKPG